MKTWDEAYLATTPEQRPSIRRWRKGVGKNGVKGAWYHNGMKGDKNQCSVCGEWFNSSSAFDRHRTGNYGKQGKASNRRCLSLEEMEAKGFVRAESLYWVFGSNPLYAENASDSFIE